jgi:hypothetical protein
LRPVAARPPWPSCALCRDARQGALPSPSKHTTRPVHHLKQEVDRDDVVAQRSASSQSPTSSARWWARAPSSRQRARESGGWNSLLSIEQLKIEAEGEIDLRGFLGIDPSVPPGYESLSYTVRVKGNGTEERFAEIHEAVMAISPNAYNVANAVALKPTLVVE